MMLETWGFWTKQVGIKSIKQNETLSGAQSFTVTHWQIILYNMQHINTSVLL